MARIAPPLPLRLRAIDIAARLLLPLIGVALMSAGLVGLVSFTLMPLAEALSSRNWIEVTAQVERAEIEPVRLIVPLPLNRVQVSYTYVHAGRVYESTRFSPQQNFESRRRSNALVAGLQQNPRTTVWVDGNAPQRATLHRTTSWVVFAMAFPSLIFTFFGAVLVLASMMLWSDRRSLFRRRKGNDDITETD
ncbi:DUF3592 domain-containing protein [Rhodocyclaceae bacterium SMB388]